MGDYTDNTYTAAVRVNKKRLDLIFGLGVMLVAFVVYAATLSTGVFPGQSGALMVTYTGLEPIVAPSHPIWGAIVKAIGGVSVSGMALRLNIFSMLVGVVCVGMMYNLVSRLLFLAIDSSRRLPEKNAVHASVIGGVATAFAFAFCVPVWMTSTRLHYQIFDLFTLLALTNLFLLYIRTGKTVLLLVFSLLFGVGVVENFAILPFAALFAFYAFYVWVRNDDIKLSRVFAVIVFGLIGLCFYFLVAHNFCATGDISLRGYKNFWDVFFKIIGDQIKLAKQLLPEQMWMFLLLLVVFPWLASLAIASRALNDNREWSTLLFHVVITGLTIATLANAGVVSPWNIYREQTAGLILPVTLYALASMLGGYLVAYWYLVVKNYPYLDSGSRSRINVKVGLWCGYAAGWVLVVIIGMAAIINGFEASGKRGEFADACSRELLQSLKGRRWLVTNGIFDNHLRVEAARTGQPLTLIELQKNDSLVYIRQIKKMIDSDPEFKDADHVRLKNSVDLGVIAFLQDWIASDPSVVDRMAVISVPDLLIGSDLVVAPNYLCFIGVRDRDSIKDAPVYDKYAEFWKRMQKQLGKARSSRDPIAQYRSAVRRQVSFVANNAGVMLEDFGRDEEAYKVYNVAREIDSDNISALLNIAEMLHRKDADGFHSADKPKIERLLKEYASAKMPKYHVWALSRTYGYVRSPIVFAQLGLSWALSGQPGMALAGLERAASIATSTASRTRVKEAMAEMLLQQNDDEKSEAIYSEILSEDPDNRRALISMSRISAQRGALDKAREWLDKAREAGVDKPSIALESAALDIASNKPEDARVKLAEVTDLQPRNLQAWNLLAVSEMMMNEFDDIQKRILPKMEGIAGTPDNFLIQITRGQVAFLMGKQHYADARAAFERASILRPGLPALLEWVLRLDYMLGDRVACEDHARRILRDNRNSGFANYVMGALMFERGRMAEAEDYLRRSVATSRSSEALNDLAELLRKAGNYEEAERQARAAIELAPNFYVTWDTLGGVLADTDRLDKAEEAYVRALDLFKDDLRVHLNLAKLLYKKGNVVKAREIVARIRPRRSELPPAEQKELEQLVKNLTPGKK